MAWFSTILKLLGIVIFGLLAVMFIIFLGFYFLVILGCLLTILIVAWVFGIRITIKQNGRKIGYVRWTKFHRGP
jgi:hypothetical protein